MTKKNICKRKLNWVATANDPAVSSSTATVSKRRCSAASNATVRTAATTSTIKNNISRQSSRRWPETHTRSVMASITSKDLSRKHLKIRSLASGFSTRKYGKAASARRPSVWRNTVNAIKAVNSAPYSAVVRVATIKIWTATMRRPTLITNSCSWWRISDS